MKTHPTPVGDALNARALAHYTLVAPPISDTLGGSPIVYADVPRGPEQRPHFHVTSTPLSAENLLRFVKERHALSFYSWASQPNEAERLRFARILIEPPSGVGFDRIKLAALAMRAILFDRARAQAVPLLDGGSGIALWIPLQDAPEAVTVRAWLHALCARAVEQHPDLISTGPNTHGDGRAHVHVSSNAVGRYSAVPYSLRPPHLGVCTPIDWAELGQFECADAFDDLTFARRFADCGDVFGKEVSRITSQFSVPAVRLDTTPAPRGYIITAAIDILGDGKARSADELLAEALARKLVPEQTKRKYVYTTLIEYIARQLGRGRHTPIVQDAQRRFCINEPPDDWPDLASPQPDEKGDVQALCDRLSATATGTDPAAFEIAVCDAFARLGFLTQHLGGNAEPDGVADAILGPLAYRVTIECKTAKHVVNAPGAPSETAKFREVYGAQRSVLVGPDFPGLTEFLQELQTHCVTALTLADLQTLLQARATGLEVSRVLVPGYSSDCIADWLWERQHGETKRVTTIAGLIVQEGWASQRTAAEQGGATNAPRLTIDAAMVLVDAALRSAGSKHACARTDVQLAFEWLTNPVNGLAVWDDASKAAIVVVRE